MPSQYVQMKTRLEPVNHNWLKERAKKNRRSVTAEINCLFDEKRKADGQKHAA